MHLKRILKKTSSPADASNLSTEQIRTVRAALKRCWPFTQGQRRWMLLVMVLGVALPILGTVQIWLFKSVMDDVLIPHNFEQFPRIAVEFLIISAVSSAIGATSSILATRTAERFMLRLRTDLFAHVLKLSPDFFERSRLGDLLERINGDTFAIESLVVSTPTNAIGAILQLLVYGAALFITDWQLACAALVVTPFAWLSTRVFARKLKSSAIDQRTMASRLHTISEERLSNVALVQSFNRHPHEVEQFHKAAKAEYDVQMRNVRIRALQGPVNTTLELIAGLAIVGLGSWQQSQGAITVGSLLVFLTYLTQLFGPIRSLGGVATTAYTASAAVDRVIELLDKEPSVQDASPAVELCDVKGGITFDQVTFEYAQTKQAAVRDVSFAIDAGEVVAVIGPSGSGKTTLMKLLIRFHDPTAGSIAIDGVDIRTATLESLRSAITYLPQEQLLFEATVAENVGYGKTKATRREIRSATEISNAHDFIIQLPLGYNTRVGERGRRISGGQRQRIALARAITRESPIIVLDEPTTGLDDLAVERILKPLLQHVEQRTVIILTHDPRVVRHATKVIRIEKGTVMSVESRRDDQIPFALTSQES